MGSSAPGFDLSKIPWQHNPSGAPPNFVNPPSLHSTILGVGIFFMVISSIFLIFRLATNLKLSRRIGFDDCLCIFAQACGIGYWVLNYHLSKRGTSRHAWDVPLSIMTVSYIKLTVSIQMIFAPSMWAAKSAILALYIRVFGTVKWLRFTCWFCIVFMALFYSWHIAISAVYCVPGKGKAWDIAAFLHCSKASWTLVVIGVFSALADIIIFILPFPVILKLHMNPAKRFGLIVVFLTGFILVVMSIISLALRIEIFLGKDQTWNGMGLSIVTFAEVFGTVMVSCAPALSAFWLNILTKSSLWSSIKSRKSPSPEATLIGTGQSQYYSTSNLKIGKYSITEDDASADLQASARSANQRTEVDRPRPGSVPLSSPQTWFNSEA